MVSINTGVSAGMKADGRIAESEARLREAQRIAQVGSWELDLVENKLFWSDEIFNLFEVDKDSFIASYESFLDHIHPDDREMVNEAYSSSLESRQPYQIIHRLLMADGRIKWVEERCSTDFAADGKPLVSKGTVQDITERILSQQALAASEDRLTRVMDAVNDGVWDWNPVTHEFYLSPRWKEILGYRDDELDNVDSSFFDRVLPHDSDLVSQAIAKHFSQREPYNLEIRMRHRDGNYRWILCRGEAIRDKDGNPVRMLGTITDITENKEIEQALRKSERRLNHLMTASPTMIYSCLAEPPYDVTFVSGNVESLFPGYRKEQFLGNTGFWEQRVHPDDLARYYLHMDEFLNSGQYAFEYRFRGADGHYRWISDILNVITDETGKPVEMIGSWRDITGLKQAEEELIRYRDHLEEEVARRTRSLELANKAKSHFLSRVSHELRTPMNAILGFAQVLEMQDLEPQVLADIREIHSAGNHLLGLINELLDLSRIETGNVDIDLVPVSIASIVDQSVRLSGSAFEEHGVKIIHDLTACKKYVLADALRLRQVLVNLLTNAAKYSHPGDQVVIECNNQVPGNIRILVTDTGPGIKAEEIGRLFTPFDRLGAEYSEKEGTGIGLALSRQLCELMNGTLGVDSVPGQGSTFWVELAETRPEPAETAKDTEMPNSPVQVRRILYIEDNPSNLRVMEAMLRNQSGYRLLSATDGERGLITARESRPDLILLDIHLPGMDGYEVLEKLKADPLTRDIPVVALTADAMLEDMERGQNAGFVEYLTKPVNIKMLLGVLATCT